MNEKQKLQIQVDKVIELLKIRIEDDPTRPILNTLIERYIKAQEILKNEGDIKRGARKNGLRDMEDAGGRKARHGDRGGDRPRRGRLRPADFEKLLRLPGQGGRHHRFFSSRLHGGADGL